MRERRCGGHGHLPLAGGGFFLIQDVELEHDGQRIVGFEVIGREKPFGADKAGEDIKSRFYDRQGNILDYVYELAKATR